jgi:hypothetical protein
MFSLTSTYAVQQFPHRNAGYAPWKKHCDPPFLERHADMPRLKITSDKLDADVVTPPKQKGKNYVQ